MLTCSVFFPSEVKSEGYLHACVGVKFKGYADLRCKVIINITEAGMWISYEQFHVLVSVRWEFKLVKKYKEIWNSYKKCSEGHSDGDKCNIVA